MKRHRVRCRGSTAFVVIALLAALVAFASASAFAAQPAMITPAVSTASYVVSMIPQATASAVAMTIAQKAPTNAKISGTHVAIATTPKKTDLTAPVGQYNGNTDAVDDDYQFRMAAGQQFRRTIVVDTLATANDLRMATTGPPTTTSFGTPVAT